MVDIGIFHAAEKMWYRTWQCLVLSMCKMVRDNHLRQTGVEMSVFLYHHQKDLTLIKGI